MMTGPIFLQAMRAKEQIFQSLETRMTSRQKMKKEGRITFESKLELQ